MIAQACRSSCAQSCPREFHAEDSRNRAIENVAAGRTQIIELDEAPIGVLALEGALSDRPWQEVAKRDRLSLLLAVETAERQRHERSAIQCKPRHEQS